MADLNNQGSHQQPQSQQAAPLPTHYGPQDSLMLLLGELRGDVKAVLHNQERLAERIKTVEGKTEVNVAEISRVKQTQARTIGYAAGVGATISGAVLILKDKLAALL